MVLHKKGKIVVVIILIIGLLTVINGNNQPKEKYTHIPTPSFHNVTRIFSMGLTPFPYDVTLEAVDTTYNILSQHTDIVAHHFDSGVPWPEAYSQEEYHQQVENNIKTRLDHTSETQEVYLALTPLNGLRDDIAGYWAEQENMPNTDEWENISFKDQKTINAYLNFCEHMIERFQPKYLAYGIEVNMLAHAKPEIWNDYVSFCEQVYNELKHNHPELPVFLTFQIDYYGNSDTQMLAVEELLQYSDIVAVSTYPFTKYPDPSLIPNNHFLDFAALSPKPFAVAETGFPSDSTTINDDLSVTGTAEWQTEYLEFLLENCQTLDAEFMIWFCPVDYDKTWDHLIDYGVNPIYKLWIDTGLFDHELREKPVLEVWDSWLYDRNNTIENAMISTESEK